MLLRHHTHTRTTTGRHQHSPMILQMAMFWNVVIVQERRWSERANCVPMKNLKLKIQAKIVRKKQKNINIHININLLIQPNHIKSEVLRDAITEA